MIQNVLVYEPFQALFIKPVYLSATIRTGAIVCALVIFGSTLASAILRFLKEGTLAACITVASPLKKP
jgi:hypothetical protein